MNDFVEDLMKEQEEREQQNYIYLDIETGEGLNPAVKEVRAGKIRREVEQEEYSWNKGWKDETNEQKKQEFISDLPNRIQKAIKNLTKMDAVSPFFNRICLIGIMDGEGKYDYTSEINQSVKKMMEWVQNKIEKKIVVTYGMFDLKTIEMKSFATGVVQPRIEHVDIMRTIGQYWDIFGKKTVLSQDELAAVVGVEPNKYAEDVIPADIGKVFENYINGIPDMEEKIQLIRQYNEEDVRVLRDIHLKSKEMMGI